MVDSESNSKKDSSPGPWIKHVALVLTSVVIAHGSEFVKYFFESNPFNSEVFFHNLSVALSLLLLSELLLKNYERNSIIQDKLDEKISKFAAEKIAEGVINKISEELKTLGTIPVTVENSLNIKEIKFNDLTATLEKNINSKLLELKPLVLGAIYNSYLKETNHFVDNFSETIRHFLQPHSGELVKPISDFMKESFSSILENGFVRVDAGFDAYRVSSNEMVESIYASPKENSIRMISVYSPLEYLHMNTVKKKIDTKDGKPNHLLVFNGYRAKNVGNNGEDIVVEEIEKCNRVTTQRQRIVFLKKKDLILLLKGSNDKGKASFMFSYLWFLSMNTEIELDWGWKEEFREYWYDKKNTENGDVDFMIFNEKYFWRYNLDEKCLFISWDPLAENPDSVESTVGKQLFGKSVEHFNKAKRIFDIPVVAENNLPYYKVHNLAPTLHALLKIEDDESLYKEFKETLKKCIEMINSKQKDFYSPGIYAKNEIKIDIFIKVINSFLEENPNILESALDNFEGRLIDFFQKGEKKGELSVLYSYYFHPSFAEGVKKIFPDISNKSEIF